MSKLEKSEKLLDRALPICVPVILIACLFYKISTNFDSDIWHILNNGRYVLTNGIPYIEPFTIHEGLRYVAQQWLADCLFWKVYELLGPSGLIALVYFFAALIYILTYKLLLLTSNSNKKLAFGSAFIVSFFMLSLFMCTRPQIISFVSWLAEIYCLELYARKEKKWPLFIIPLLSIVEINCHAALWLMVPALIVPFLADYLPISRKVSKTEIRGSWKLPALVLLISLAAGFINPYGLRAMLLVFRSLGGDMSNILELHPLSAENPLYALFIIYILVSTVILFMSSFPLSVRSMLMLFGGLVAALMAIRNFPIFVIAVAPYTAEKLSVMLSGKTRKQKRTPDDSMNPKLRVVMKTVICLIYIVFIGWILFRIATGIFSPGTDEVSSFLTPIADYLENEQERTNREIRIFSGFNDGAYLGFRGFRCYIDARGEIYLEKNNGVKDYLEEYFDVITRGTKDHRELLSEYNFTHVLAPKSNGLYLSALRANDRLQTVFENGEYCLFEVTGWDK